jgi:2-amino-4-hydroxy-6-hydroxymethyldihydropteridine diphosphokinase
VRAYLSLGSNLGDRAGQLRAGVTAVAAGDAARVSPLYETEPVGGPEQGRFLNVVVELETDATPHELLARCQAAEAAAGRVRTIRFGPRTLDCDVLLVGELVVDSPDLVVPHPRMLERRFVLQPLADLAPELVDPAVLEAAEGEVSRAGTLSQFH